MNLDANAMLANLNAILEEVVWCQAEFVTDILTALTVQMNGIALLHLKEVLSKQGTVQYFSGLLNFQKQ